MFVTHALLHIELCLVKYLKKSVVIDYYCTLTCVLYIVEIYASANSCPMFCSGSHEFVEKYFECLKCIFWKDAFRINL